MFLVDPSGSNWNGGASGQSASGASISSWSPARRCGRHQSGRVEDVTRLRQAGHCGGWCGQGC